MSNKICPQCRRKNAIGNTVCYKCGRQILTQQIQNESVLRQGAALSLQTWQAMFSPAFYFCFLVCCFILLFTFIQQNFTDFMLLFKL